MGIPEIFQYAVQKLYDIQKMSATKKLDYIQKMIAIQLKMARVALGLTVRETAELCDVSHDTITRLEAGAELKESTVAKVRAAIEKAGIIFVEENGEGPGVRLKKFK